MSFFYYSRDWGGKLFFSFALAEYSQNDHLWDAYMLQISTVQTKRNILTRINFASSGKLH